MSFQSSDGLIYAAFFFVDIVGLSNPVLSTETQKTKIKVLNELIYSCKNFSETPKEQVMILPTGDGMLIGFKNGLEEPIKLAIEFHEKLSEYNTKVTNVEKISTRIGCNVGHVFVVKDIYGNINLWGPGAILARRVMDLGNKDHILLSNEIANDLMEVSEEYEKILHPIHNFEIKHGENLLLYSAFGNGFGNPTPPNEKTKIESPTSNIEKKSKCNKMIFNIIVKEPNQPVRFERFYHFSNHVDEPLYEIAVGIVANSENEFKQLNLKAFDESNNDLEIPKIIASSSFSKLITVKLSNPVFDGDSGKMVKISYDSNLTKNQFENFFLLETGRFELNFSHFSNLSLDPRLYYLDNENGNKHVLDKNIVTKGMFTNHKWEKLERINLKDLRRLEW
jgi:hypothetical protein